MYSAYLDSKDLSINYYQPNINPINNKFYLGDLYPNSNNPDFLLPGINIEPGSITVLAGSNTLVEDIDYTVDYNVGLVRIINERVFSSGQQIRIQYYKKDQVYVGDDLSNKTFDSTTIRFEDNLFSEPTQYYSNIEGGLGIFGAYNMVEIEVK